MSIKWDVKEQDYLLPTWVRKITYWRFNWMLQLSSGKCRSMNKTCTTNHWKSKVGEELLPPCLLIAAVHQSGTSILVEVLLWGCHEWENHHPIHWEETTVLDHGRGQELLMKEALHIQMTPSEEHFNLDWKEDWNSLVAGLLWWGGREGGAILWAPMMCILSGGSL